MKKTIKLIESDLTKIIKKIINESYDINDIDNRIQELSSELKKLNKIAQLISDLNYLNHIIKTLRKQGRDDNEMNMYVELYDEHEMELKSLGYSYDKESKRVFPLKD